MNWMRTHKKKPLEQKQEEFFERMLLQKKQETQSTDDAAAQLLSQQPRLMSMRFDLFGGQQAMSEKQQRRSLVVVDGVPVAKSKSCSTTVATKHISLVQQPLRASSHDSGNATQPDKIMATDRSSDILSWKDYPKPKRKLDNLLDHHEDDEPNEDSLLTDSGTKSKRAKKTSVGDRDKAESHDKRSRRSRSKSKTPRKKKPSTNANETVKRSSILRKLLRTNVRIKHAELSSPSPSPNKTLEGATNQTNLLATSEQHEQNSLDQTVLPPPVAMSEDPLQTPRIGQMVTKASSDEQVNECVPSESSCATPASPTKVPITETMVADDQNVIGTEQSTTGNKKQDITNTDLS